MSYNKINRIFTIEGIANGALSLYCRVSACVVCITRRLSAVGWLVFRHGRCVYNAIVSSSIFDAMLIYGDVMGLNAIDVTRYCAAQQDFLSTPVAS